MMTRKDFEALARALNPLYSPSSDYEWGGDSMEDVLQAVTRFCAEQNPKFDADRFRAAVTR